MSLTYTNTYVKATFRGTYQEAKMPFKAIIYTLNYTNTIYTGKQTNSTQRGNELNSMATRRDPLHLHKVLFNCPDYHVLRAWSPNNKHEFMNMSLSMREKVM